MDQHVWQRLATVVLAALIIFSINTFSPIGNDDGLGIATVQAKKEIHQLPSLLGQQIVILMGLDINPNWVREQSVVSNLIYGVVKPDGMVPAGINGDCSYLVTSDRDKEISLFSKADKKGMIIKHANHGEKLHTKTAPLSRLVERPYRTKKRCQQVNEYANALRTE